MVKIQQYAKDKTPPIDSGKKFKIYKYNYIKET